MGASDLPTMDVPWDLLAFITAVGTGKMGLCTKSFHLSAGEHLGGDSKEQPENQWLQWPVQQLLCDRISIIVGQKINPLVVEAKVTHQPLDNAGLLEDGVAVGPLQSKAGEELQWEPDPPWAHKLQNKHPNGGIWGGNQQFATPDRAVGMSWAGSYINKPTGALPMPQRGQAVLWSHVKPK